LRYLLKLFQQKRCRSLLLPLKTTGRKRRKVPINSLFLQITP
jgi:hypothetical protein